MNIRCAGCLQALQMPGLNPTYHAPSICCCRLRILSHAGQGIGIGRFGRHLLRAHTCVYGRTLLPSAPAEPQVPLAWHRPGRGCRHTGFARPVHTWIKSPHPLWRCPRPDPASNLCRPDSAGGDAGGLQGAAKRATLLDAQLSSGDEDDEYEASIASEPAAGRGTSIDTASRPTVRWLGKLALHDAGCGPSS